MVPEGWIKLTLSEACEMKAGKFVKAEDIARESSESSYPCYGGNGLRGYTPSYTHDGYYPLIGRQGELCGNVMFAAGKFHATEHAVVVKAKNYTDTTWLYFKLVDLKLNRYATGQAQPGLSVKNLEKISFIAPRCTLEQKKIAAILSTWDKAITTTEQLLANSQQQKKALMQQLLTGKKRLLDKNGVRFSGEWDSYELGDWIREYNEKSVSSDQHEVLTSSRGGLVKQSEYFADSRISQRDNIGFNVIPPGYITYRSRSDDGQFFFNRNELSFTGIISTYYPVFHFPEGDSTFFLNYLNRSSSAFAGYSVGTSQKVLSLNALKAIKARLPKKEEQQKIAAVLSTADEEISALQQKLDALKQEKKALMQQLLNGKRRVKVDEVAI